MFDEHKRWFCASLDHLISDHCWLAEKEVLEGRVYGKESCKPEASECRIILPLGSMLSLLDVVLSERLMCILSQKFSIPMHCYIGGVKKLSTFGQNSFR